MTMAAPKMFKAETDSPKMKNPHTMPQITVTALFANAMESDSRLSICCHPMA